VQDWGGGLCDFYVKGSCSYIFGAGFYWGHTFLTPVNDTSFWGSGSDGHGSFGGSSSDGHGSFWGSGFDGHASAENGSFGGSGDGFVCRILNLLCAVHYVIVTFVFNV
jgi:hypothetical protein